jgi:hypothetical protein
VELKKGAVGLAFGLDALVGKVPGTRAGGVEGVERASPGLRPVRVACCSLLVGFPTLFFFSLSLMYDILRLQGALLTFGNSRHP